VGQVGAAVGLDGGGVEVDEKVVADDDLGRAVGGDDHRAAALAGVAVAGLEDVIGDDVLPGAERGERGVAVGRAEVAHGDGAGVAHVVADEVHEA